MNRAAVSLILAADRRVLCVWSARYHGWTLPGGRTEEGESLARCQRRELVDATGLATHKHFLVYAAPNVPKRAPDRTARVHVYRVMPQSLDTFERPGVLRWMTYQDFLDGGAFREFYKTMQDAGVDVVRPTVALTPLAPPVSTPPPPEREPDCICKAEPFTRHDGSITWQPYRVDECSVHGAASKSASQS